MTEPLTDRFQPFSSDTCLSTWGINQPLSKYDLTAHWAISFVHGLFVCPFRPVFGQISFLVTHRFLFFIVFSKSVWIKLILACCHWYGITWLCKYAVPTFASSIERSKRKGKPNRWVLVAAVASAIVRVCFTSTASHRICKQKLIFPRRI